MKANIYTISTIKGPGRKDGCIGYLLEALVRGEPKTKEQFEIVSDTSAQRSHLMAVVEAMERIREGTEVTLYTESPYVYYGWKLVDRWQSDGWKNSRGEEVRNQDLWEAFYKAKGRLETLIITNETHSYRNWLLESARNVFSKRRKPHKHS